MASVITAMLWTAGTASAAGADGGTAQTIPVTSGTVWGACSDPFLIQAHAQCGYVSVPLDYGDPGGQQIQIAVSRITHTSSNYQGVILVNPGGPASTSTRSWLVRCRARGSGPQQRTTTGSALIPAGWARASRRSAVSRTISGRTGPITSPARQPCSTTGSPRRNPTRRPAQTRVLCRRRCCKT